MKIVKKEWGCEIWWANTELYMGKTLIINPGCSTSLHYHNEKDETILVMRGELILDKQGEFSILKEGQAVRILPKISHRLKAGLDGITLVESSTPHPDDSVRIKK